MSLPQCAEGQAPFKLLYQGQYDLQSGATPYAACQAWADANHSWSFVSVVDSLCTISSPDYGEDTAQVVAVCTTTPPTDPQPTVCAGACTITVKLDAADAIAQLRAETVAQVNDPMIFGLDPQAVATAYAFAFGAVLGCFVLGWLVSVGVNLVKKI